MDTKALSRVTIKDADQGIVEAVFSTFGVIDHDGDVTAKGAIADGAPVRISSYNHTSWGGALPVGKGTVHTRGNEAILRGQFFMNTAQGRDTFETVKQMGELQEWSYGFDILDSEPAERDGKRIRLLKRLAIHEVSPVLLGAGIGTRTLSAKGRGCAGCGGRKGEQLGSLLRELRDTQQLSNEDLAGAAGVDVSTMGEILAGEINCPPLERLQGLARLLDVPLSRLRGAAEDDGCDYSETRGRGGIVPAVKRAIPTHETEVVSRSWDGPGVVAALPDDARPSQLRSVFAWVDPDGDPEAKSSYKFPHHHGIGGPANVQALIAGIAVLNGARGGADIPDADRQSVFNHLAAHLRDADREPPELRDRDSGHVKNQTLSDELMEALVYVSGAVESASRVVALRAEKGKTLSRVNVELLDWIGDDLKRLQALLAHPPAGAVSEEEITSTVLASLARIHDL